MKKFLQGLWQIILGLLATLGVWFVANVCVVVTERLIQEADPMSIYLFLTTGLSSGSGWFIFIILILALAIAPVCLGIFVAKDAGRFRKLGVVTLPVWWGIGVALPSAIIVLPVYFYKRHLVWPEQIGQANLSEAKIKRSWKWPWILVILILIPAVVQLVSDKVSGLGTKDAVEKIHNTKLTLDDVMGKNLPPSPSAEVAAATVAGIDENKNGIRDDVELAIFKAYPNSAKTRAVLLQYALALQMEMTQKIVNTETVIAVSQEESRASMCIGDSFSRQDMQKFITVTQDRVDFVEKLQFNNILRVNTRKDFNKKIGSFASIEGGCDIDISKLQ